MQTHCSIAFGDGSYCFRLSMAGILAIEEKCNAGIGVVYSRVLAGRYEREGVNFGYGLQAGFGLNDVMEVCRQGLIGGNSGFVDGREIKVSDHLATHLVRTYLHPESGNPIIKAWDLAAAILHTCLVGYNPDGEKTPDDAQKKSPSEPGTSEAKSSAMDV